MARNVTSPPDPRPGPDGVKAGGWWHEAKQSDHVVCDLCPRGCVLGEGARGFCFVRQNLGGQMVSTTYGRSTGFCVDPIEKAAQSFLSRFAGLAVRHGRLQPGVQVLPELVDLKSRRSPR